MRIKYLLLFGFLFFVSGHSFAQEAPLEVTVAQDEFVDESVDETDIPYEDFSEHESEEPVYTEEEPVPENKVTLQSALAESVTSNPLLSLETTGSIFDQFSAFEKSKMLMNLQTEEEKMQLERDRVHLQRLKLEKELMEYSDPSQSNDSVELDGGSDDEVEIIDNEDDTQDDSSKETKDTPDTFSDLYTVKTIMGVGKRLIAVLENISNSQKTQVKVGTEIDGYVVREISSKKGITVEKDGELETVGMQ